LQQLHKYNVVKHACCGSSSSSSGGSSSSSSTSNAHSDAQLMTGPVVPVGHLGLMQQQQPTTYMTTRARKHTCLCPAAALQVDPQGSWLLDGGRSKRIAVHMRRGDVTSLTTKRALPTSFYLNVVKQVIQVGLWCVTKATCTPLAAVTFRSSKVHSGSLPASVSSCCTCAF
jgi:hypothetical protein